MVNTGLVTKPVLFTNMTRKCDRGFSQTNFGLPVADFSETVGPQSSTDKFYEGPA